MISSLAENNYMSWSKELLNLVEKSILRYSGETLKLDKSRQSTRCVFKYQELTTKTPYVGGW